MGDILEHKTSLVKSCFQISKNSKMELKIKDEDDNFLPDAKNPALDREFLHFHFVSNNLLLFELFRKIG
jgi:hypothetical protein